MARPDRFAPGLLRRLASPPRRLAVLKASRIGDFLCCVPALQALRRALPQTHIVLVTLPMLRSLAERLPCIDRVVDFPGFPGIAEQLFEPRRAASFFTRLQAARFDLALQLQGSGVHANPFVLLLGARHSAGFVRPGDGPGLLDAALPLPQSGHEIERMNAMAAFLGAPVDDDRPTLALRRREQEEAARLLAPWDGPLIGIHAGARDPSRCWPWERFERVAQALMAEFGATPVVLGEPGDEAGWRLARALEPRGLDLVGRTSLPLLAAVVERLDLLLTTDSGPAHMAYTLGTPTVTVLVEQPARYGPPAGGPHRVAASPRAHPAWPEARTAPDAAAVPATDVLALAAEMLGRQPLRRLA